MIDQLSYKRPWNSTFFPLQYYFFDKDNTNMSNPRWIFALGEQWLSLDAKTQQQIEQLWYANQANWVSSDTFRGPIYVDTELMTLIHEGNSYAIARLGR
jgi:hypothetical protein